MAERRMFARSIVSSARFLRMPSTARLLYYDLGMEADDDGCVESFGVMRRTGAAEEDLQLLAEKGFIKILNEDLVACILDWKRNNCIRKDRYHRGLYADLLESNSGDAPSGDNQMPPEERQGKARLGKARLGEARHEENPGDFLPPSQKEVEDYCRERKNNIDPRRFVDYYTGNGWMMGKSRMKDWKAAVRSWETMEKQKPGGRQLDEDEERAIRQMMEEG